MNMSGAIASLDSSTIYAFNAYSLTGLEYPQFLVLNSTTGSPLTSTSTFALTCPYIYKMNIKESKVYSLAVWISRAYFIIYDIQNNNFEFYSAYANPTIILYGFLFEAVTGR